MHSATPTHDESQQPDPFMSLRHGGVELYIVRHADALPDADEVVKGGYDAQALSALGRRQAEALADRLRAISFAAIYTSPMARAVQTAGPTAVSHELEVQPIEELREIALGPLESDVPSGATPEEVSAQLRMRLREIANIAVSTGSWESIPGAEPSALLRARLITAFDRIIASHPGERVLVVSHAGAINAYLAAMLGMSQDYFFPTANTSISMVRAQAERWMLFSLNDVAHLVQAGLFSPRD